MNTIRCALWNETEEYSQKRGKQPSTVGSSNCFGEVHRSLLASKIRNSWSTVKDLLILGLKNTCCFSSRLVILKT